MKNYKRYLCIFMALLITFLLAGCASAPKSSKAKVPVEDRTFDDYDQLRGFQDGLLKVMRDDKYGFLNTKGELVIPCKYDYANAFSEGRAIVRQNGLYGFIDTQGTEICPPQYDGMDDFRDGMSRVKKDEKYGYIDLNGNLVLPFIYLEAYSFSEGIAFVYDENEKTDMFINTKGEKVFPLKGIVYGGRFSQGVVRLVDRYAGCVYNNKGVQLTPAGVGIEKLSVSSDGTYHFVLPREGDGYFINNDGERLEGFNGKLSDGEGFSEGQAVICEYSHYYFIDSNGKKLFKRGVEKAKSLSEGMAEIKMDGKWGYINMGGEMIIPCKYGESRPFRYGYTYVLNGTVQGFSITSGGYDIIDKEGKVTISHNDYIVGYSWGEDKLIPCISLKDGLLYILSLDGKVVW